MDINSRFKLKKLKKNIFNHKPTLKKNSSEKHTACEVDFMGLHSSFYSENETP